MKNPVAFGHGKFLTHYDDVVFFQFNNNESFYNLDLKTAKKFIDIVVTLCNGKPMSFIIDIRGFRGSFSADAANFLANSSELLKLRISEAFITNSIATNLLIASYKRIYDPITPHVICDEIRSAEQYCLQSKNTFYGSD